MAQVGQQHHAINLPELVEGMKARGIDMPVLLRFSDLLRSRIEALHEAFGKAMDLLQFRGAYRGVYPIKVNQQQQVVEEVVEFGRPYHHGLEAGSKAELAAALAYIQDPESLIVCNGYKDEEFVDLALYAQKMGFQPYLVVEMPSEVPLILQRAEKMGINPLIGVRAKLTSMASGHWQHSSGDRSTFGLSAPSIIETIDLLKEAGKLDCLHMLHFHIGSQISSILEIRGAVSEAMRFYLGLIAEGAPMRFLDIGGGLAVDYDGSHSNSASSCNYSLDEYASDVVEAVMQLADEAGVAHPEIISESGRATVAHHSVLLFNILESSRYIAGKPPTGLSADAHPQLISLQQVLENLDEFNAQESYNDALYYRDELRAQFEYGKAGLRERAHGEQIFREILSRVAKLVRTMDQVPEELGDLNAMIADVYHANFSVFQSLPDAWAIDQLFPVMPIHRLDQEPVRNAVLSDITCDCDGHLSRFIDAHQERRSLPLHPMNGEDYYLGVFLVGAYQETLGDLHNLLGDTNVLSVRVGEDGEVIYAREIAGDTVADVLSYVEYNPREMIERMRHHAEQAVQRGRITPRERRSIMSAYQEGLQGYTYFET